MLHLDLDDINHLFQIYPKKNIKRVWMEELVPQGDFILSMNLCFALLYFGAKNPRRYVKSLATRQFNKRFGNEGNLG